MVAANVFKKKLEFYEMRENRMKMQHTSFLDLGLPVIANQSKIVSM
jgi:hypothetical protein